MQSETKSPRGGAEEVTGMGDHDNHIRFCEHCTHRNDCKGKELYKEELREGVVECLDYQDEEDFTYKFPMHWHLYTNKDFSHEFKTDADGYLKKLRECNPHDLIREKYCR